jgi:hypothetical protein
MSRTRKKWWPKITGGNYGIDTGVLDPGENANKLEKSSTTSNF